MLHFCNLHLQYSVIQQKTAQVMSAGLMYCESLVCVLRQQYSQKQSGGGYHLLSNQQSSTDMSRDPAVITSRNYFQVCFIISRNSYWEPLKKTDLVPSPPILWVITQNRFTILQKGPHILSDNGRQHNVRCSSHPLPDGFYHHLWPLSMTEGQTLSVTILILCQGNYIVFILITFTLYSFS